MPEYRWTVDVSSPSKSGRVTLGPSILRVGRDASCQIRLRRDPAVADRHCEIEPFSAGYLIRDVSNGPGLKLNGRPTDASVLHDGDRIELGATTLVVHREVLGSAAAPAKPADAPPAAAPTPAKPAPTEPAAPPTPSRGPSLGGLILADIAEADVPVAPSVTLPESDGLPLAPAPDAAVAADAADSGHLPVDLGERPAPRDDDWPVTPSDTPEHAGGAPIDFGAAPARPPLEIGEPTPPAAGPEGTEPATGPAAEKTLVQCSKCQKILGISAARSGQLGRCPACRTAMIIPNRDGSVPTLDEAKVNTVRFKRMVKRALKARAGGTAAADAPLSPAVDVDALPEHLRLSDLPVAELIVLPKALAADKRAARPVAEPAAPVGPAEPPPPLPEATTFDDDGAGVAASPPTAPVIAARAGPDTAGPLPVAASVPPAGVAPPVVHPPAPLHIGPAQAKDWKVAAYADVDEARAVRRRRHHGRHKGDSPIAAGWLVLAAVVVIVVSVVAILPTAGSRQGPVPVAYPAATEPPPLAPIAGPTPVADRLAQGGPVAAPDLDEPAVPRAPSPPNATPPLAAGVPDAERTAPPVGPTPTPLAGLSQLDAPLPPPSQASPDASSLANEVPPPPTPTPATVASPEPLAVPPAPPEPAESQPASAPAVPIPVVVAPTSLEDLEKAVLEAQAADPLKVMALVAAFAQQGPARPTQPVLAAYLKACQSELPRLALAQRDAFLDVAKQYGLVVPVTYPPAEALAMAVRGAERAWDPAETLRLFHEAQKAGVPLSDGDRYWLVRTCAAQGDTAGAAAAMVQISPAFDPVKLDDLRTRLQLPAPPLKPKVVLATYLGGPGDQYVGEVGFKPDGSAYGKGDGFEVIFNPVTGAAQVTGSLDAPAERVPNRKPPIGKTLADPRNGQTYTIGYRQVHPILQQPFLESSAGWKLWGEGYDNPHAHELMADSRGYDVWLMPNGLIGCYGWADGGNSVLNHDPRDLTKPLPLLGKGFGRGLAKGGGCNFFLLDPAKAGEVKAVASVYMPAAYLATDLWGRIYLPIALTPTQGRDTSDTSLGMTGRAGLGVLAADLARAEVNARLGGMPPRGARHNDDPPDRGGRAATPTLAPELPGDEWLGFIAQRGNLVVLGGTTAATQMSTTPNAPQAKPGGGQDGLFIVIRLWE